MDNIPSLDLSEENDLPQVSCNNINPTDLKLKLNKDYSNRSFSLFHLNIRSCRRNFNLFLAFLTEIIFRFSVIVLTETWLSHDIDNIFEIEGISSVICIEITMVAG